MPSKRKRDNAYYLRRLEKDFPALHAKWLSGGYSSPRKAFLEAGLMKDPERLNQLKRLWGKSSSTDRHDFIAWLKAKRPPKVAAAPRSFVLLEPDRTLTVDASTRVKLIMMNRGVRMGTAMDELGLKRLDPSLGLALRGFKVRPVLEAALSRWIEGNKAHV